MKLFFVLLMTLIVIVPSSYAQDDPATTEPTAETEIRDLEEGAKIFKTRCAICHKMDAKLIGPALKGITERLEEEYLVRFIRNSQEVIQSGDTYAVELYQEYNELEMISNPDLSDDQIKNILAYIDPPVVEEKDIPEEASTPAASTPSTTSDNSSANLDSNKPSKEVGYNDNSLGWKDYFNYWLPPLIFSIIVILFMKLNTIINSIGHGKNA